MPTTGRASRHASGATQQSTATGTREATLRTGSQTGASAARAFVSSDGTRGGAPEVPLDALIWDGLPVTNHGAWDYITDDFDFL